MNDHDTPAARAYVRTVAFWGAAYVALVLALSSARNAHWLVALMLTQVLCSVWGFLEIYAGAQHLELYLVVPIFWATYGAVCSLVCRST